MADNIVAGLFGLTPNQIQQQQQAAIQQQANAYAQQAPFERATAGMYQGGAGLGQIGAGMLGMVNPEVEAAKQREAVMAQGGLDMSSVGLNAKAEQFRQAGDLQTAMRFKMAAQVQLEKEQEGELKSAQMAKALAETEKAQRPAQEGGAAPTVSKLLAERSKYAPNSQEYKVLSDAIRKETYIKSEGVGGGASERPSDKLLNKDQRWVQKDGEFVAEIIPGSKTFNTQKGAYSADKDTVKTIQDSYKSSKSKIDNILADKNKSSFGNLFGGYTEKFIGQHLSGKTASVNQKLESLKSEMKAAGLQITRSGGGVGQITEKEWGIMEKMIDSLDPTMDENDAREVLKEIGIRMELAKNRAEQKFDTEWAGSQFESSKPSSKGGVKFLGFE